MIITTIEELRQYFPSHAFDDMESLAGVIDTAEHMTLADKLGYPLYKALLDTYASTDLQAFILNVRCGTAMSPYAVLLKHSQRIVAYDAMCRDAQLKILSINNAGINIATADDYAKATKTELDEFRNGCTKNLHDSINKLLELLEAWASGSEECEYTDPSYNEEKKEIVELWKKSRFFCIAADLLIPNVSVLTEHIDVYSSREKFVRMIPELRYIQEEIISDAVGVELVNAIVAYRDAESQVVKASLNKLRKVTAFFLKGRSDVLTVTKDARQKAMDEAQHLLSSAAQFIKVRQSFFPESFVEAFMLSPLYEKPKAEPDTPTPEPEDTRKFGNNRKGNSIFVMPGL